MVSHFYIYIAAIASFTFSTRSMIHSAASGRPKGLSSHAG